MRANLVEANGEIAELDAWLSYLHTGTVPTGWRGAERIWDRHVFTVRTLYISFEHAYHHINYAWNSRFYPAKRVVSCAQIDFRNWERFPADFGRLMPRQMSYLVREVYKGRLDYFNLRRMIREATMFLESAIKEIEGVLKGDASCSDETFARDIELTLAHLNMAWHCRRYEIEQSIELGCKMSNLNRWKKYPREFTRFWEGKKSSMNSCRSCEKQWLE